MPGYVIHIAVAQEYLKKHKNKKENPENKKWNTFNKNII